MLEWRLDSQPEPKIGAGNVRTHVEGSARLDLGQRNALFIVNRAGGTERRLRRSRRRSTSEHGTGRERRLCRGRSVHGLVGRPGSRARGHASGLVAAPALDSRRGTRDIFLMNGWIARDVPDQTGKCFVITGANSGLGLETAKVLARKGAHVVLACRTPSKAESAAKLVLAEAGGDTSRVSLVTLDLADLSSVEACAKEIAERFAVVDGLINNAGLMAIPEARTKDGFEMTFGTNHLGHFALTGRLLPLLRKTAGARVVVVASAVEKGGTLSLDDIFGEKRRYDRWRVYFDAKLANAMFMKELAYRLDKAGEKLLCVGAHPGYAATELQGKGATLGGSKLEGFAMELANKVLAQSQADGALPQLRAATDPSAKNGDYFGPAGLGELRGPAKRTEPKNSRVRDAALRAALWDESVRRTGVDFAPLGLEKPHRARGPSQALLGADGELHRPKLSVDPAQHRDRVIVKALVEGDAYAVRATVADGEHAKDRAALRAFVACDHRHGGIPRERLERAPEHLAVHDGELQGIVGDPLHVDIGLRHGQHRPTGKLLARLRPVDERRVHPQERIGRSDGERA